MKKLITLLAGAQRRFVKGKERFSAYIGGLGSGKTFAGIVKGVELSQQPLAPGTKYGPRGLFGAINYPVLKDVVLTQFFEVMAGSNLWKHGGQDNSYLKSEKTALLKANCGCADRQGCDHVSQILFRSLDDPDVIRGVEFAWAFIDEGRHLTRYAFDVVNGRLRQQGYTHHLFVASTPNGYDWMWQVFHADSPDAYDGAVWYNAATRDNTHLPEEYIESLEATYEGKFYDQELLGRFVGIVSGGVYPHWDSDLYAIDVPYDPRLPLYTFWDFGIGDPGVCLFAQMDWLERDDFLLPRLKFIDFVEAQDWTSKDWATAWTDWLTENSPDRRPERNVGDPAGRQRQSISGTSVIDDLNSKGVPVGAAPKRPLDYGIRILDNMMAGGRVLVDRDRCSRLAAAFSTHKWPTDDSGQRTGTKPVHDWTSHFADAARYGATALLTHYPQRKKHEANKGAPPGSVGDMMNQLTKKQDRRAGLRGRRRRLQWIPPTIQAK